MNKDHDERMREAVASLRRAHDEIAKTLTFLEEVRRVEEVIERDAADEHHE